MSKGTEGHFDTLPIGRLGLIPLNSSAALGKKVDDYLVSWRKGRGNEFAEKYVAAYEGYERDSYIIQSQVPRFGSGEAKGIINESVRGDDIYILLDVCNYSLTYSLCGYTNHMSPDDHFQDLKRVIAAIGGKARRINVIMPFLYESRQHLLACACRSQRSVYIHHLNVLLILILPQAYHKATGLSSSFPAGRTFPDFPGYRTCHRQLLTNTLQ